MLLFSRSEFRFTRFLGLLVAFTLVACSPGGDTGKDAPTGKVKTPSEKAATKTKALPEDLGDMLVSASIGDASNLIPFLSGDSASSEISGMVFASLLRFDKDFNLKPYMAEKWKISEDQLTITFHLNKEIVWHDGEPFTSADLMYQYEMMIHPDVPSAYKETFTLIKKASAPGPYTFTVTFEEPFSPALMRLSGMTGLPRHLLKDTAPVDLIRSDLARKPVGHGPYRFVEWKSQTQITLESNETYFLGRPPIFRNVTRVIPDLATQFLELKSGSIDTMGLEPMQYLKQTDGKVFRDNFVKYKYLGNGYTYLGFNFRNDLFKDVRVRRAITLAIDKSEIIEGVLLGLGQPATGPIKPGTWAFNPDVKKFSFDPEKAKELLKEAGYTDSNGDGILDKDGKNFEFTIITNQGNALRKKTGEIIQQRLSKIGISVNLRVLEWSSFINNFINKRKFDACILGWSLSPDPDQYPIWHSSKTGEHEFNFISYNNPEVDSILDKARKTFDIKERKKLYFRFQEILAEDQPYSFLYVGESLPIVSKRIQGIIPGPAGISYNYDSWWVNKEDHKYAVVRGAQPVRGALP